MRTQTFLIRFLAVGLACSAFGTFAAALTPGKLSKSKKKAQAKQLALKSALPHVAFAAATSPAVPPKTPLKAAPKQAVRPRVPAIDPTLGDVATGENAIARQSAVQALGRLNGSIVVSEAGTGKILAMVNQKMVLKSGFQPCSTIKVPVALAALSESVVDRTTQIRLYGKTSMAMTEALAKSNNQYFASLGEKLGFERVSYYARLFGLGEKAGLNIEAGVNADAEQPGILPAATPKSGMGMMTSFGDGITLTPLEFAGLLGAVANGGNLYYLQYPKTPEAAEAIEPRMKRRLEIADLIPEIKPGMMGAVEYGTARRAGFDPNEPIYGKTGTCSDKRNPTRLGWFGSFTEVNGQKVVVVVLLTGGTVASGPSAAGVAGQVYKNLQAANYFAQSVPDSVRPQSQPTVRAGLQSSLGFQNFVLPTAQKP